MQRKKMWILETYVLMLWSVIAYGDINKINRATLVRGRQVFRQVELSKVLGSTTFKECRYRRKSIPNPIERDGLRPTHNSN